MQRDMDRVFARLGTPERMGAGRCLDAEDRREALG